MENILQVKRQDEADHHLRDADQQQSQAAEREHANAKQRKIENRTGDGALAVKKPA